MNARMHAWESGLVPEVEGLRVAGGSPRGMGARAVTQGWAAGGNVTSRPGTRCVWWLLTHL